MAEPLAITERRGFGLAAVMARQGVEPAALGLVLGVGRSYASSFRHWVDAAAAAL